MDNIKVTREGIYPDDFVVQIEITPAHNRLLACTNNCLTVTNNDSLS